MARVLSVRHVVVATCHASRADGLIPLDVTDRDAVLRIVADGAFTHVVNCAAFRSPEYCRAHPEDAYRTNALAVEFLAEAADSVGALLCQVSTDYVFPGTHPPYREEDAPLPVNLYGRTKLAGEYAARSASKHLVTRIPALYRTDVSDPRNVVAELARWLRAGVERTQDAVTVRYYTLADDVAMALRFALEVGATGILHLSAEQKTTKAEFARGVALALGCNPRLVRDEGAPKGSDRRPMDSHLDPGLYYRLGGERFTDMDVAFARIRADAVV